MLSHWQRWIFLISVVFSGCSPSLKPQLSQLTNDAYIWQRRWNSPVLTAINDAAPEISQWRVLAAEVDSDSHFLKIQANRRSLHNPVILVVRVNALANNLVTQFIELLSSWQKEGAAVAGLEIDYDCPTSQLASYRDFLRLLRDKLPHNLTLSITGLPSWLDSTDLPNLLSQVDQSVLQVHSVMNAKKGLFDAGSAHQWIKSWSSITPTPFQVALPTYWSRVSWNNDGRVAAIESEVSRHGEVEVGRELFVDPQEISAFVAELRSKPPPHLRGIAWFRLPTSEDQRAWKPNIWYTVMRGQALQPAAPTVRVRTNQAGGRDVYLFNESELDRKFPAQVTVSSNGCEFADALPPYALDRSRDKIQFQLNKSDEVLRGGQERLVGWVRCSGKELDTHVSF